jgi:sulfite reductase (NADPH) flavoprotein alpha-component
MITICFGSETGNAEGLADDAKAHFEGAGNKVEVYALEDVTLAELSEKEHVLIITSTWGDGEPPSNALSFDEELANPGETRLDTVKYSVLALGDSAYPEFCKFGKDIDEKFAALGAKQIYPIKMCDVFFDDEYKEWIEGVSNGMSSVPA